jgi:PTH1 family peptidyl-tRNA hydrolase
MKLIIGLGNPGEKYENNRHNVGFMIVDEFAERKSYDEWKFSGNANALYLQIRRGGVHLELLKPQISMNLSGTSVAYAVNKHKIPNSDVYVIHDDLDIKLGDYKVQVGKGPKEHKGLISIYESLGKKNFWHVRVGIENRPITHRHSGEDYVLQNFTNKELEILNPVIDRIVKDLIVRLTSKPFTS